MNTCRTCGRELVEGEGTVCDSCWNTSFERVKDLEEDVQYLVQKHRGSAAHFNRCRTTQERVGECLADLSALLEVVREYVRCGGAWN
ncbi:MAG: hypothetical protein ACKOEO_27045 [Planctomycetaceae bacterium]